MHVISTLILCIALSFLFRWVAKELKVSVVVGLIIAGIIIGSPIMRDVVLEPNTGTVLMLGDIGLIFLMFLAGLEISWSMMYRERKEAAFVAAFASVTPFLLGFVASMALGLSLPTALTVGICMSVTAEATKARELMELKKLKSRLGTLMLGAGITDDIIGIGLFAAVCYFFEGIVATEELIVVVFAMYSFFTGIVVHKHIGRESQMVKKIEEMLLIAIVPFFFISTGINFSPHSLIINPILFIVIISVAAFGKIMGVMLTSPFTRLDFKQLFLVGWALNSRGAVDLALTMVAFKVGLVNTTVYSSLVAMALITTLIFPFILRYMVRKYPKIMK